MKTVSQDYDFDASKEVLEELIRQHKAREIDVVLLCMSQRFTLEPCVPYAWQPTGKTIDDT